MADVPLPFLSQLRNISNFGSYPWGRGFAHRDPCKSCQGSWLVTGPAWTPAEMFQFGVVPLDFPLLIWEEDDHGAGVCSCYHFFLCSWVAFAVSPARCDLWRCSSFP